ncbi:phosphotransferase enzyme family protein [Saccharomonospora azurea]|uniref:phosphotransferase enzyme family protein n=1 Tax=Saccharomonospora azurea TaxID=40988 RepID=UPI003D8F1531
MSRRPDAPAAARVGRLLSEHYSLDVRDVVAVGDGADRAASVWQATGHDGRAYAVKLTTGGSPAGLVLADRLALARPGATPRPVHTAVGTLWATVAGARLSVTEWVDGRSAADVGLSERQWIEYGRVLAALHGLPVAGEPARRVPRETFDPGHWVDCFDRVDARLADLAAGDDLLTHLVATWNGRRSDLRVVRDRTVRLGRSLATRAAPTARVCCHADAHLGNVVVTGPESVALLDFDDAVLAPPERDLMFVLGGGVWAEELIDERQQDAFLRGYGSRTPDRQLLAYYRGLRTLEDVADPATVVLDVSAPREDRAANLGYVTATVAAGALLDQALRSE